MSAEPFTWAPLVPELACSDFERSVAFYVGSLGAQIAYQRDGFAYVTVGAAQMMLERADGAWSTATLERPFGRGINLQIEIDDVASLMARLTAAGTALFRPPMTNWYAAGDVEHGQHEFLVQDPDGYLLRFVQVIGERRAAA